MEDFVKSLVLMALENSPGLACVIIDYKNNNYPGKLKEELIQTVSLRSGVQKKLIEEQFTEVETLAQQKVDLLLQAIK